ncbi:hypothetical protein D3C80_1755510 [compost metagenome]
MYFDIAAATAEAVEQLVLAVGQLNDFVLAPQQAQACIERILDADDLYLGTHQWGAAGGDEAAIGAGQLGHVRSRGDDGGFFHHQRHQHITAVDLEVAGHGKGQLEGADDVFDHAVGDVHRQGAGVGQQADIVVAQAK